MSQLKVNFSPCHDNILVKRDEIEEKVSPGGIVLPKMGQDVPVKATVIAVGPGRLVDGAMVCPGVRVEDRIVIGKYTGNDIDLDGEKYTVIRWEDVLGTIPC